MTRDQDEASRRQDALAAQAAFDEAKIAREQARAREQLRRRAEKLDEQRRAQSSER